MMDLTLEYYDHDRHYPLFWKMFSDFWKTVNGVDLEKLKTVWVDGNPIVVNGIEEKLAAVHRDQKKIKLILIDGQAAGFLQYKLMDGGVLFLDSLWVEPKYRYEGFSRFIINSFPQATKYLFQIHKDLKPEVVLSGLLTAKKVKDCTDGDLELWEAEYLPETQGVNRNVVKIKSEMKKEVQNVSNE